LQRILISACLMGEPVRHDGSHRRIVHDQLETWMSEGRLVPFCPEVAGGLPTPRPAAERTVVDERGTAGRASIRQQRVAAAGRSRGRQCRIGTIEELRRHIATENVQHARWSSNIH
jgi:uncharacterized protein YbbK (DUF523 family)